MQRVAPQTWRRAVGNDGQTAACVAGEARTIVLPNVQQNIQAAVLSPLRADAFLVLAATHTSATAGTPIAWYDERIQPMLNISHAMLLNTAKRLSAVSLVIADEGGDLLSSAETAAHANGHIQQGLIARWTLCLREIRYVEDGVRGRPYRFILRARPDLRYSCALHLPPLSFGPASTPGQVRPSPEWAAFNFDYFAFFTRGAAEVALGQPDPSIPTCNVSSHKYMVRREEWCQPCLMRKHNVSLYAYSPWRDVAIARPCRRDHAAPAQEDVWPSGGCTCISVSSPEGRMRHDSECTHGALAAPSRTCAMSAQVIGTQQPWQTRDNFMRFALVNQRVCGFNASASPPNDGVAPLTQSSSPSSLL